MKDRYGVLPEPVQHLLAAGEIRVLSEQMGIASIERKRTAVEEAASSRPVAAAAARPGGSSLQPLRPGQIARPAAPSRPLQHGTRTVMGREVTNATLAARATAAVRPAQAPMRAQAGQMKAMRDMLHLRWSVEAHAESFANAGRSHAVLGPDPAALLRLVQRHSKEGRLADAAGCAAVAAAQQQGRGCTAGDA